MSTNIAAGHNARFMAGWILLLIVTALMTLNHAIMIFALDEPILFAGFTATRRLRNA
jgi:hypothetical protein